MAGALRCSESILAVKPAWLNGLARRFQSDLDGGAAQRTGITILILLAERGEMLIYPCQAVHHQAEIQGREFTVSSPLQAGKAQAASAADRSAGVRQGGPPDCMCLKSWSF
jgi:hypothetical protein